MVFGLRRKKDYGTDDFIISNKELKSFKSTKRKQGRENKRKDKLEAMKVKTQRLKEKNIVLGKLEHAKKVRANIKRKQFARRTASVRRGAILAGGIIKKVKKRRKGHISNSPFAPEKWK